jgi:outer membrane lipopolysaccharide assembly protein LptE/RlpB
MWRFLIILFFLSGCGYHFAGSYGSLPQNIKNLYIENVQNQTIEPGIDIEMERALSNELNLDKRIRLKKKDEAEGILNVSLTEYKTNAIAFNKKGIATRFRSLLCAQVELSNREGKILRKRKLSVFEDYEAKSSSIEENERKRREALTKLTQDLSREIREFLFIGF